MTRAQTIALAVTLLIVAAVVAYGERPPFFGRPGEVRTRNYSAVLGDTRGLEVDITMGAGTLRVYTIDSAKAYEAEITRPAGWPEVVRYADGHLRLSDRGARALAGRYANDWSVGVSLRVPVDLEISTGAGRATLDLTGMRGSVEVQAGAGDVRVEFRPGPAAVQRLELRGGVGRFEALGLGSAGVSTVEARSGVGEFVLDFSGAARGTTQLEVRGGVGSILLLTPGWGVRIRVARGATRQLSLPGFKQVGEDEYVNDAWGTGAAQLDVRASLGVGRFEVRGR